LTSILKTPHNLTIGLSKGKLKLIKNMPSKNFKPTTKITFEITEELKSAFITFLKDKGIPLQAYLKSVILKAIDGKDDIIEEDVAVIKPNRIISTVKEKKTDIPRERAMQRREYNAKKMNESREKQSSFKSSKSSEKSSKSYDTKSKTATVGTKTKTDPKKSRFNSESRKLRTSVKSSKGKGGFAGKKKFFR
jgi:hypothetical protein